MLMPEGERLKVSVGSSNGKARLMLCSNLSEQSRGTPDWASVAMTISYLRVLMVAVRPIACVPYFSQTSLSHSTGNEIA
jgi:hypothetical protein